MVDFDVIKSECKIGDTCFVEDSKGRTGKGIIRAISKNTIVIENDNGNQLFFAGSSIEHFELISSNKKESPIKKSDNQIADIFPEGALLPSTANEQFLSRIIPAKGKIKYFDPSKKRGMIEDNENNRIKFQEYSLLDIQTDDPEKIKGISVVYSLLRNTNDPRNKKGYAGFIHRGETSVKENLDLMQRLISKNELNSAKHILMHIIEVTGKKTVFSDDAQKTFQKSKKNANEYKSALNALSKRDFDLALDLLEYCIKNDMYKQKSIKKVISAFKVIKEKIKDNEKKEYYRKKIHAILSASEAGLSQRQLADLYFVFEDYKNFIPLADLLLKDENEPITSDCKIKLMMQKAVAYFEQNDSQQLLDTLNDVLTINPEHKGAQQLKYAIENPDNLNLWSHIEYILSNAIKGQVKLSNEFDWAKSDLEKNDFNSASYLFEYCINNGIKTTQSANSLVSLFIHAFNSSKDDEEKDYYRLKAANTLPHYEHLIQNKQILADAYYTIGNFEYYIKIANQLLEDEKIASEKSFLIGLMVKKAAVLYKLNDVEKAWDTLNKALAINPENKKALNLKKAIEESNDLSTSSKIESIISEDISLESLVNGTSLFIRTVLSNYDEYFGISNASEEITQFDKSMILQIRNLIKDAPGRIQDQAKYLLTEAKLMMRLEPDKVRELRTVMANYCYNMAKFHITERNNADTIRFYYNEAFALEDNKKETDSQIAIYLFTDCMNSEQLLDAALQEKLSIDFALQKFFSSNQNNQKWNNFLSMSLHNTSVASSVIKKIYSNLDYRKKAIDALKNWNLEIDDSCDIKSFEKNWNDVRKKLDNEIREIKSHLGVIPESANIEDLIEKWQEPFSEYKKRDCLCETDKRILGIIVETISPAVKEFIKASGYKNKDAKYSYAYGQLNSLINDIETFPTKMSYESFLPLLKTALRLLEKAFDDVVKVSEPKVKISLLSSETVVEQDNQISFQVSVSTEKNSSPIREVSVTIKDTGDINALNDNTYLDTIEGGESHIFKIKAIVSPKVIQDKAMSFSAVCHYTNRGEKKEYQVQLPLVLYSPDDFVRIKNPYIVGSPMSPENNTSNMFYGRESFIQNIIEAINNNPSKQVIIYGQKRCGKTSVLNYLKQGLSESGNNYCINFSMGDIIHGLSAASFYYQILNTLKTALQLDEMGGEIVPEFNYLPTTISEFEQEDPNNPVSTFSKYMLIFKQTCLKTNGWQDKKLVVMIDEFTYLYTAIKKNEVSDSIMKQWKSVTQNDKIPFSVVLVGHDVVPTFKKEDYARNAFGVIEDKRLTYLADKDARNLIIQPILDENGNSRFIGNAVDKIIDYTSNNPYYIQIFCDRLVNYMNENKLLKVTEADVYDVAQSFVKGEQALTEDKFDNLIRAGESADFQEFPESEILEVLINIAFNTKNIPLVSREDINALKDKHLEELILQHLVDREVLKKENHRYKIQVKLFQEWLVNHY